ncbi:MAG: aspartate/glutamate racemase family protein [Betaproteobacteria bacterium]
MNLPTIGLIVPPASGQVPPDGGELYAGRASFIARGLGLGEISPDGFDQIVEDIVERAVELRDAGAVAVSMMGTSLSFYRGAAFTEDLRARMAEATGLPCTTMSHAIVAALRALGVRRVAVATSYIDALNQALRRYLESRDFEVVALRGLSVAGVDAVGRIGGEELTRLARATVTDAPHADGLLISCGGLRTFGLLAPLEAELGMPVTASSPAGFWDAMRVAGLDPSADGFGRLFAGRDLQLSAASVA